MLKPYEPKKSVSVSIEVAYAELSKQAFSVWIRMHVAARKELVGREKIAKLFGYSVGRCNDILRELSLKNYIKFDSASRVGDLTKFKLAKRAFLSGDHQFINL